MVIYTLIESRLHDCTEDRKVWLFTDELKAARAYAEHRASAIKNLKALELRTDEDRFFALWTDKEAYCVEHYELTLETHTVEE